jgi:hypothetical protein
MLKAKAENIIISFCPCHKLTNKTPTFMDIEHSNLAHSSKLFQQWILHIMFSMYVYTHTHNII